MNAEKRATAPTAFYMNYVGCKVASKMAGWVSASRFYMNYVGCKD